MARRTYSRVERAIIALMLLGMVGMFQPFLAVLYRYGFLLLLCSTIGFIIISHLVPKADADVPAPIGPGQATEHAQRRDQ
ncbi:MAG TPA: hypothetical protein VKE41_24340 [Roseiflexaceae bacterium]|nr:hypothetical protein [Roseiflexaceae bacterium]